VIGMQAASCSAIHIAGNVSTRHQGHGFSLTAGTTGCTIEDNEAFATRDPAARRANGIFLSEATSNVLRRNRWHDNQDSGEQINLGSNDNISVENVSWHNGDHGYDHLGASGTLHVHDVAYANFNDGFSIEGNSPN